ncbi:MAG: M16 family metallopeptidase [Gemmatimonadota bacterium]
MKWLPAVAFGTLLFASPVRGQEALVPTDSLPLDPLVSHGTLANGLQYYVRENREPRERAELRLVVDAGSVLEEEDQRGLAHLLEHMAFNGTTHFGEQELVDYLESIGMRFGPDVNAFTSFDETVYMLTVPTDSAAVVETGFQILEDWAHGIALDPDALARERPVVVEEWRLGRGAEMRMLDEHLPVIFKDSRYAVRLPIGEKEIIEDAPVEAVRRFYEDWYRPGLMAVIAVGDFEADSMVATIERHFGAIPAAEGARPREVFPVPGHTETLVSVATDPEARVTTVTLYNKHALRETGTVAAYRRSIVEALHDRMLNARFEEIVQRPDAPFIFAFAGQGRFVRPGEVSVLAAVVPDGGAKTGIESLLTEAERAARHGFNPSELERAEAELLREVESAYLEREKTESQSYAGLYMQHFLEDEPAPGIEAAWPLHQRFVPEITLDEVNRVADEWLTDEDRVVVVSAPEREGLTAPADEDLLAIVTAVEAAEIEPWEDEVATGPLVDAPPEPGALTATRTFEPIGAVEWTFGNGVRVVARPTDFKADEILLQAWSPGGTSHAPDSLVVTAAFADAVVREGGVGDMNKIALQKALAGKKVALGPGIGGLQEGFTGRASPEDLETMLELVWLYFTSPREDPDAFEAFRQRLRTSFANRSASPEAVFQDTLSQTLAQHHPRAWLATVASVERIDLDRAHAIYGNRFADAGDFTFFLVGAFDPDTLLPLVRHWLGSLPSTGREETWVDNGIDPPPGVVRKTVRKGIEPKSRTEIVFAGDAAWSPEGRYAMSSLVEYLRIRLREVLREDLGGTYGVRVAGWLQRWPDEEYQVRLGFGADPARIEALVDTLFMEIEALQEGADEATVAKVREAQRRALETDLRENVWWIDQLEDVWVNDLDPGRILEHEERIAALDAATITDAARRWLPAERFVRVTLVPEAEGVPEEAAGR